MRELAAPGPLTGVIMVRVNGGLGNQMFQYAAARRLALAHGVELRLDTTPLERSSDRVYQLDVFNIAATVASPAEVAERLDARGLFRRLRRAPMRRVREAAFHFDPAILEAPRDVYLEGYWQSERYFEDAADRIRRELTFRHAPQGRNAELGDEINSTPLAICVHVRRGDYVSKLEAQRILGPCDTEYYATATARLREAICHDRDARKMRFFVFSDDPDWVRRNLRLPGSTTVVDHNGPEAAYEDLRLMRLCRHHIIANSTFSWWGAWLASAPDQIVIAPKRWFRAPEYSDKDLIPSRWIRL